MTEIARPAFTSLVEEIQMKALPRLLLLALAPIAFLASPAWAQGYVPFKVQINGGLCDSGLAGTSNPEIHIDGNAPGGTFLVNSILLKTDNAPFGPFSNLSVNSVTIDGTLFDTRTANLVGPADGSAVLHSADIMGVPVRVASDPAAYNPGGNFPHEIVASSAGADDIVVELFCSLSGDDMDIDAIVVAGWKRSAEVITVSYVPGS
jgi:hypothetical protein